LAGKKIILTISVAAILAATLILFRYKLLLLLQTSRLKEVHCGSPGKGTCSEKLWVHRVNDLPRYRFLQNSFTGFETDISFDSALHSFLVYHPSVQQKQDAIKLSDFLNGIDLQRHKFWFDTRYVDSSNAAVALSSFGNYSDQLKISAVFEFYDIQAANFFAEAGYTVSLNFYDALRNDTEATTVRSVSETVQYISQDARYIPLIKKTFPAKKIAVWHLKYRDSFRPPVISKILADPQVQILLLNVKSP